MALHGIFHLKKVLRANNPVTQNRPSPKDANGEVPMEVGLQRPLRIQGRILYASIQSTKINSTTYLPPQCGMSKLPSCRLLSDLPPSAFTRGNSDTGIGQILA